MEVVAAPFFAVVVALCLLNALKTGKPVHYVLLGLSLGLGAWFYPASWIFALGVVMFLVWRMLRAKPRHLRFGVTVVGLAMLLVTLPLQLFFIQNPSAVVPSRYRDLSVFDGRTPLEGAMAALQQTPRYLLMFNVRGESAIPRHNLPGRPMLEFPVAVLAALGVVYGLVKWREGNTSSALVAARGTYARSAHEP
jgi:hypothetical protein